MVAVLQDAVVVQRGKTAKGVVPQWEEQLQDVCPY